MKAAPWWAGVLVGILTWAKARYPEHAALIEALILGLAGTWAVNLTEKVKARDGGG